jgi:hypothetical protein
VPIVKSNGTTIVKGNNGGKSSYFFESWTKQRIKEEVEHAVANNHGRDLSPGAAANEYFGFSKDGKVQINFYIKHDGTIGSYFPKVRKP